MPLHFPVLARSLRTLLLHRPLPRAPRQSSTPHRLRRSHPPPPRRRSPAKFRRGRKNPPHRQRRQHPPLEPLRPPTRNPPRVPCRASRPIHLRVLRHSAHPNPHPRSHSLISGTGFSLCYDLPPAFVGRGSPRRLGVLLDLLRLPSADGPFQLLSAEAKLPLLPTNRPHQLIPHADQSRPPIAPSPPQPKPKSQPAQSRPNRAHPPAESRASTRTQLPRSPQTPPKTPPPPVPLPPPRQPELLALPNTSSRTTTD